MPPCNGATMYGQVLRHSRPCRGGGQEEEAVEEVEVEEVVTLNVGGVLHRVARAVLMRFPQTRLARLLRCPSEAAILELCDDYSAASREFYFDRSPRAFRSILNFYLTGHLHVMEELCVFSFDQELEYWGIPEPYLAPCCSAWYHERKAYIEDRDWDVHSDDQQPSFDSSFEELSNLDKDLEKFKGAWCADVRRVVWLTLEDPGYSLSSKVIMVASLSVVLTSIVAMCVHSMPEFQKVDSSDRPVEDPVLAILEVVCIICFSTEFAVRLAVAPSPRKFLSNPLNMIDFASILPFYATLAFETMEEEGAGVVVSEEESENLENVGKVVQVLRLMRVFRILKLARHSIGLRALGATVRHSYQEVGLLILFLSVGISIFSVLIYSAEKEDSESDLGTIPVGWWWATITMTTVGYGDTCPVTVLGKMVATLCIIVGLLVVALPISIIFNKFSKYYQRNKAMDEANQGMNGGAHERPPDSPYAHLRELYAQSLYPFLGAGISFKSSESSEGDDHTDASSLQEVEEEEEEEEHEDAAENRRMSGCQCFICGQTNCSCRSAVIAGDN